MHNVHEKGSTGRDSRENIFKQETRFPEQNIFPAKLENKIISERNYRSKLQRTFQKKDNLWRSFAKKKKTILKEICEKGQFWTKLRNNVSFERDYWIRSVLNEILEQDQCWWNSSRINLRTCFRFKLRIKNIFKINEVLRFHSKFEGYIVEFTHWYFRNM